MSIRHAVMKNSTEKYISKYLSEICGLKYVSVFPRINSGHAGRPYLSGHVENVIVFHSKLHYPTRYIARKYHII